jgi:hypothetical protein
MAKGFQLNGSLVHLIGILNVIFLFRYEAWLRWCRHAKWWRWRKAVRGLMSVLVGNI